MELTLLIMSLAQIMLNLPEADRQQLKVRSENGKLLSFEGSYMMLKARKA
ncbi:hypothetical protein AB4114_34665 [Paenibacillus sp. 2RAB27]